MENMKLIITKEGGVAETAQQIAQLNKPFILLESYTSCQFALACNMSYKQEIYQNLEHQTILRVVFKDTSSLRFVLNTSRP